MTMSTVIVAAVLTLAGQSTSPATSSPTVIFVCEHGAIVAHVRALLDEIQRRRP